MTVDEVRAILAEHRAELDELGVASLSVFGSVARGEAGPNSDVDLLVELRRRMGPFGFFHIQNRLEDMLGREADLVMPEALRPGIRERAEREAVHAT